MENNTHIKIVDIKKIIEILLTKLDSMDNDNSLILDKDLYWNIVDDEVYNVYKNPTELTIGSLVEDWEFLQKVINGKREMIDYDLNKMSNILKFLGNKMIFIK